jgi:uncharacterized protein GlcG (DUF336 family)
MTALRYGESIDLAGAMRAAQGAIAKAESVDADTVVAVVDAGGHLVALLRRDHTQFGSIAVAEAKARSAVAFKRSTRVLEDSLAQSPRILAIGGAMPVEGGLPLVKGDLILGAIGAAGATPSQDGEIGAAGAAAFESTR